MKGVGDLELEVHVRTPEGKAFLGRCVDLESALHETLVFVEFQSDQAPALRVGQTLVLEFRAVELDSVMRAEARTVLRTDAATCRRYCFRGQLTKSALLILGNRRRSARVRPIVFDSRGREARKSTRLNSSHSQIS